MTHVIGGSQDSLTSGLSHGNPSVSPGPPAAMRLLESVPYKHPRATLLKAHEKDHWTFSCRGTQGASLAHAHDGTLQFLDGPDDVLLAAEFCKVTIMLNFPGYTPFRRVKNVQRVKRGVALPTLRSRVVECVAEAMALFIQQAADMRPRGDGAVFGTGGVTLSDLYLLGLDRYGRTLVPVFGITPRAGNREQPIWQEAPANYAPALPWGIDVDYVQGNIEA